jgi:DNA-directed RNA polymerase subunit F
MIGKKIIESEPISGAEVKETLEAFSDENELNYEQNLTLNHLARFKRYSAEDSKEIIEKLQETLPNLKTKVAVHIVDLVPQDLADLRLIFAKEAYQPDKEEMEQILEILEQYDVIE